MIGHARDIASACRKVATLLEKLSYANSQTQDTEMAVAKAEKADTYRQPEVAFE